MSKLTEFQEKLIADIQKEFGKLNAKNESIGGNKKFSMATIENCINEEEKFIEIIRAHNVKMIDTFSKIILKEVKDFNKEFGKVIDLKCDFSRHNTPSNIVSTMVEANKGVPKQDYKSYECNLYFVSKVKFTRSGDSYDIFNRANYVQYYLDFKREIVSITLESGKQVKLYKIIGVQYLTHDWLRREHAETYDSLNEMLQMNKNLQKQIVDLVQK